MRRMALWLCAIALITAALPGITVAELPTQPRIINNMVDMLRVDKFSFAPDGDSIVTWITVSNVSGQAVEGVQLGCAFADYFDESWSVYRGFSAGAFSAMLAKAVRLAPKSSTTFNWRFDHYLNPPLTGYVWVDRLRLADGSILRADLEDVAARIAQASGLPITSDCLR